MRIGQQVKIESTLAKEFNMLGTYTIECITPSQTYILKEDATQTEFTQRDLIKQ